LKKSRSKVTLCLETEEDVLILCEGNSKEEMDSIADYLSKYFGFSIKREG